MKTAGTAWGLAIAAALALGCATADRPVRPAPPPNAAEQQMGYREAVALGADWIAASPYAGARLVGAEPVRPNYWRVRFGLARSGSGRVVDLYFDGARRTLVKHEEIAAPPGG